MSFLLGDVSVTIDIPAALSPEKLDPKAFIQELKKTADFWGVVLVKDSRSYLKDRGVIDRGVLRNSIKHKVTIGGGKITITVFSGSKYGLWVHEGTGPAVGRPGYWVPFDDNSPFVRWFRRKFKFLAGDEGTLESTLQAIRMSIHRFGTPPTPFLREPLEQQAPNIERGFLSNLKSLGAQ